jgi:hypothetical protein
MLFARKLVALIAIAASTTLAAADPPAFPSAVGQGAAATGGRGGDVYHVTTLEDYSVRKDEPKIPGSLRHALRSATGPRTIVFDVSGVIRLKQGLQVNKDNITIAGQTSPGGITLFGYPFEVDGAKDVVVRHIRVRCGDLNARGREGAQGNNDLDASSANAVQIGDGAERAILDHVSASWGMDETLSITWARDVTVQNSIVTEALDQSFHAKGDHGYGSLVRGTVTPEDQAANRGGYTLYGNLWAHNRARNPSIGGEQSRLSPEDEHRRKRTDVNVVNCVVYDWSDQATHRSNLGAVRINLLGNYYIIGPAKKAKYFFRGGGGPDSPTALFQQGNYFDRNQNVRHDGDLVATAEQVATYFNDLDDDDVVQSDGEPLGFIETIPADAILAGPAAYERVVASVGASLWRDAVDERVVASLKERSGRVIDTQEDHRRDDGVLPGIDDVEEKHRAADFDRDADGMADAFEKANGLNPNNAEDRNGAELAKQRGLEGYTNLEIYLDAITREHDAY